MIIVRIIRIKSDYGTSLFSPCSSSFPFTTLISKYLSRYTSVVVVFCWSRVQRQKDRPKKGRKNSSFTFLFSLNCRRETNTQTLEHFSKFAHNQYFETTRYLSQPFLRLSNFNKDATTTYLPLHSLPLTPPTNTTTTRRTTTTNLTAAR